MSEPDALLQAWSARSLDWPAVRGLFQAHAISALGRRALAELVPRGEPEARAALARLSELIECTQPLPLQAVLDAPLLLSRARAGHRVLGGPELFDLARFLRAFEELAAFLDEPQTRLPACRTRLARAPAQAPLRMRLEASLDSKGELLDQASPRLAALRRSIAELQSQVERSMRALAHDPQLRAYLAEGLAGKVQLRGGRAVLAVRATQLHHLPGLVHDRSASGETLFVEPQSLVEPGNRLAALLADEGHEEARLLAELSHACFEREEPIARASEAWAELELAAIGAAYARVNGARAALLPAAPSSPRGAEGVTSAVCGARVEAPGGPSAAPPGTQAVSSGASGAATGLLLRSMRHPLLLAEQSAGRLAEVIPLDLRLGGDFDILVITGPNTGGKTLALKSAGLAALLTAMGLPLPCEPGTTVPLYAGVIADIGDEQAIEQSLSTFSAHLKRIRSGLERAGPDTLVLFDELGGGTDPEEGAALSEAILEALLERRAPALVSTHIGKLKEFSWRHERTENASVEFDLVTLAPRFRLAIGLPGDSQALHIARRLGLPAEIVARATERLERRDAERQELFEQIRASRASTEATRTDLEGRVAEIERLRADMQRERAEVQGARELVEAEAQRGLEERVSAARAWLAKLRALLPQLSAAQREALEPVVAGLEHELAGAALNEKRQDFFDSLKKGDFVWAPRFKRRLQVLRASAKRREVVVKLGARELTLKYEDVTAYDGL